MTICSSCVSSKINLTKRWWVMEKLKSELFERLRKAMGVSAIKDMTPEQVDEVFQKLHDRNTELEALIKRYEKEAIEMAKEQERFAGGLVIREFENTRIPRHAKAGCIGEFKFTIENGNCCPECYHEKRDDCELCEGDTDANGLSDLTATVPWDLCKDIWLAMNKIKAEELKAELEKV